MRQPHHSDLDSSESDAAVKPAGADGIANMCSAFQRTVAAHPDAIALRTFGSDTSYTWAQYAEKVAGIAGGLVARGLRRGDPVALLLTNRPEFHFVDTAVQHAGGTPFSCYNTSSPEQLGYLLRVSGARIAVTEQILAPGLLGHLADPASPLQLLILVDGSPGNASVDGSAGNALVDESGGNASAGGRPDNAPAGGSDGRPAGPSVLGLDAVFATGFDLAAAAAAVRGDDLLTLVYTSGTTGTPKGVEITHANMLAMVSATGPLIGVRAGDRLISFLPAAHIADRWASHYLNIWCGTEVTCLADHRRIAAALVEVRPTLFGGVPQVWQRIVAGIRQFPDPFMRAAIEQAAHIGVQYRRAVSAGGGVPAELSAMHAVAEQRVLVPLRAKLGLDQVRVAVTAAAPTPPEVVEFVSAIGVPLVEAWGMSEVSGMGAMVPLGEVRPGSIGVPVPGLEVRILDDGELLVRGPVVMRGYRDQPEETAAAIDPDGWLHTGDVATRDDDGYLRIVDRKKELLITTGGKNIAPAGVELALRTHCPLLGQAVVVGDARPYLTALLVLDTEAAAAFAASQGLEDANPISLAGHPVVRAAVAAGVEAANASLSRAEHVRAYELLAEVWLPDGDLVTPTMKVRRRAVLDTYAEQIDALYELA